MGGDVIFVVHRPGKSFSSLQLDLVTSFGRAGGFGDILNRVTSSLRQERPLSVDLLFAYVSLISAANALYHRQFIRDIVTPFVQAMEEYMSHIPGEQLRSVLREKLDLVLIQGESLMRRVYTAKTKGERAIKLKVGIALSLLRSELLERRIQAIRLIAETCKAAKLSQANAASSGLPSANDPTVLSSLLQVPQVIEEIFGKRSHIELIQRSTEILKFFLLYSNITRADFDAVWACCEQDEQSKAEIVKVIGDSAGFLPAELITLVVEKYKTLPKAAFKDQDVALIYDLGVKTNKTPRAVLMEILGIMWEVVSGEIRGVAPELYSKVMERFCVVITSPNLVTESTMRDYFAFAYTMLAQASSRPHLIGRQGRARPQTFAQVPVPASSGPTVRQQGGNGEQHREGRRGDRELFPREDTMRAESRT